MPHKPRARKSGASPKPFPVVGIGASAGGLEAFRDLLHELPARPGMAFVLLQHLDPTHKSMLSELLAPQMSMKIREATPDTLVEPDHVYVIPPNAEMTIQKLRLQIRRRPVGRRSSPIDVFLASLAEELKSRAIGVILSGTATDGVRGLETIKAEGGITFGQDEKTARFPELPRAAAAAGCVDVVMTPKQIAAELARIGHHPYVVEAKVGELKEKAGEEGLEEILGHLRQARDADFSLYKRATIARRIARRMALLRLDRHGQYLRYLRAHAEEAEALHEDLLIKVSGFFRDPEAFKVLRNKILPALLKGRPESQPLRIWVPGCSTGEEAYSIAILVAEHLGQLRRSFPCQIFATDLSERAVDRARAGIYPETVSADVSPERLRRYFVKTDQGYQITKPIRDMVVLARQNLIKDPPFSRMDLISCRNVLIYMEPVLHRRLLSIFHYALRPGGYLMLGSSETVGAFSNLFQLVDRKARLYSRRQTHVQVHFDVPSAAEAVEHVPFEERHKPKVPLRESDIQKEVDRILLRKYTPPGVVIAEDFEILQFRGDVAPYLRPASGRASLNLLKMAAEGLLFELRSAVQRAAEGRPIRTSPIRFAHDGRESAVRIHVQPLGKGEPPDQQYLVLFEEADGKPPAGAEPEKPPGPRARRSRTERDLQRLREELLTTKDHLQSIIEEQEATNEELKSANEEVLSSNEELQSTNEELETAKEELQSTNEELTTLNEELQNRNAELSQVNSDISNLLTAVSIPIVMVGNDLRIRRFTPASEKVLNLIPGDIGRPITDIKPNLDIPDLGPLVTRALEEVNLVEVEIRDRQGRWYLLRIRPYKTVDNKIDGAVLVLLDIDALKRTAEELDRFRGFSSAVWDALRDALLLLDPELRIRRASASFYRILQSAQQEVEGRKLFELDGGAWNAPRLRAALEDVLTKDRYLRDVEVRLSIPRLGPQPLKLRIDARQVRHEQSGSPMILMVVSEGSPASEA